MDNHYSKKIIETINEGASVRALLMENETDNIIKAGLKLSEVLKGGGKILFCGNGGSAADSQHLAAELVIRLRSHINRKALPAIALTVDPSIMTAGGNDIGFDNVFARAVEAYGRPGDALVGISTSGNSENVIRAIGQAWQQGMTTIGLLGNNGGKIIQDCDMSVCVPSKNTARIQECHIMIGHIWCEMIEEELFPDLF